MTVSIKLGPTRAVVKLDTDMATTNMIYPIIYNSLVDKSWDPVKHMQVIVKKYLHYDHIRQQVTVPTCIGEEVHHALSTMDVLHELDTIPEYLTRDLKIKMKKSFTPREHQVPVIEYLKNPLPARKGLAIQTGSGKTVSSIAGMVAHGKVGLIVVSKLHHQWVRALFEFTDISKGEICVIQGINSLKNILSRKKKPEVFVCSLETLRAYCIHQGHYAELPTFSEFCKLYGIGTKIMDEVHLNFHADTIIDLSCDIPNNIYLTATFTSGNPSTREIFNRIYPKEMRYGEGNLDRYTAAYSYRYVGNVPERKCLTIHGYSHVKYEKFLLKNATKAQQYFEHYLQPVVMSHYINRRQPGEKLAVFFSLIEMVEYAYKWFRRTYPDLKTVKYIAGVSDQVLVDNDIIITTQKSCGVGSDIKNLIAVINTVSMKSPPAIIQLFGRLRRINGTATEFAELCDINLGSQRTHLRYREPIIRSIAKSYTNISL